MVLFRLHLVAQCLLDCTFPFACATRTYHLSHAASETCNYLPSQHDRTSGASDEASDKRDKSRFLDLSKELCLEVYEYLVFPVARRLPLSAIDIYYNDYETPFWKCADSLPKKPNLSSIHIPRQQS